MKNEDIQKMTDSIDDKYIEEAVGFGKKQAHRPKRKLIIIAAACITVVCISVAAVLYATKPEDESSSPIASSSSTEDESDISRPDISYPEIITEELYDSNIAYLLESRYKNSVYSNEEAYEYDISEKCDYEIYDKVMFFENLYRIASYTPIKETDIGRSFHTYRLFGSDSFDGEIYSKEFEIFEIKGVDIEYCIAAYMDGGYYPFRATALYETLGDLFDSLTLYQNMPLTKFGVNIDGNETPYSKINDEKRVWQLLLQCADAKYDIDLSENMYWQSEHEYISFTARSRKLGIDGVIHIATDGTIWTNILSFAGVYDIGEEKAKEIIDYALNNSSPTERTPRNYWIYGHITEITDEYILIDDSLLVDENIDGVTYKLKADDKIVKRGIKYENLDIGDIAVVMVNLTGYIDEENGNIIYGVTNFCRGHLSDGDIVVFE